MFAMEAMAGRGRTILIIILMVIMMMMSHNFIIVESRYHYHKNPKSVHSPPPPLSEADNGGGDDDDQGPSPPPQPPQIVPSDPATSPPPQHVPSDPATSSSPPQSEPGEVVPSDPAGTTFDVTEYGAVGDGEEDDTAAFREAWKGACAVEGGVVVVPAGKCFVITSTIFSGPCKPGLVFQLDGVIMPPDGPQMWPDSDSRKQWLVFYKLDDMTLSGSGTIQGNGDKWWEMSCKPHRGPNGSTVSGPCDSPVLIRFFMSSNLVVRGISIKDSPQFHMKFNGCRQVLIEEISISSPKLSPNTDGIHIQDTSSVGIYNSRIANGDDCISIGTGCRDVDIKGVTCGPSHGISIGSLGVQNSQACVSNITVRDSTIRESDNGLRIKTWQGGSGSVTGIVFEGILMDNVRNCINVDQYYCLSGECRNQTSAVHVSDVQYRRIKGTYDARNTPIHFACSDTLPCTNITMDDVELLPHEGQLLEDPYCWNAYGAQQSLTIPPVTCLQDGQPLALIENSLFGC